jgi:hypothetical protein
MSMTIRNGHRGIGERVSREADARRRQLRHLLHSAADTARQTRRVRMLGARVGEPFRDAVRDRVSMLLSAAG